VSERLADPGPAVLLTAPEPDEDTSPRLARRGPGLSRLRRWPVFSASVLSLFALAGIFGKIAAPRDPNAVDLQAALRPPVFDGGSWTYPLGTDELGRDILSRLLAGAQASLLVALSVVVLAGLIGLGVALAAGFGGGRLDAVLTRVTDGSMAFPYLLLAVIMVATFRASLTIVIVVLVLAGWPQYARVLRAEILKIRTQDYVTMSRVMAGSRLWIVRKHVVPNIMSTLLVLATLQVGLAIIAEGSLSFLGIGLPPPTASWGGMLAEGRNYLTTAWWLPVFPAICLSMTVLAANLAGDWLRSRSDPTTRR
jgi:peptide/nickel transport system permease protein